MRVAAGATIFMNTTRRRLLSASALPFLLPGRVRSAEVAPSERVVQTGSMGEFRVASELALNGVLGKISRVDVNFAGPAKPNDLAEEAMEPGLDWDQWLGPAPVAKYSSVLSPRGVHGHYPAWREYAEYGGGGMTDFGAHHLDIAQWGLGMDGSGPVEARPAPGALEAFAKGQPGGIRGTELSYASGVVVRQVSGYGVEFVGSDGVVRVDRGRFELVLGGKSVTKKSVGWDPVKRELVGGGIDPKELTRVYRGMKI